MATIDITKPCTCCTLDLPLDEFYRSKLGKFGRRSRCKSCEGGQRNSRNEAAGVSDTYKRRFHRMWVKLGLPTKDDPAERNVA